MLAVLLLGCPYGNFEGTDAPPGTPPPGEPLPSVVVQEAPDLGAIGTFAAPLAPLQDGFAVGGPDWQVRLRDASGNAAGMLDLTVSVTNPEPTVVPIGVGTFPGVGQQMVFAVDAPVAGQGRIQLWDGSSAPIVVSPEPPGPGGATLFYARAAAILDDTLVVAENGENALVQYYADPRDPPTGSWYLDDIGAGDGGRTLSVGQLDDDAELELLVGTGGDEFDSDGVTRCRITPGAQCDTAAIWGLERPQGASDDVQAMTSRVRFHFRTDGSTRFDPQLGPTAVSVDLDNDGCNDLVVGSPFERNNRGVIHVVPCVSEVAAQDPVILSTDRMPAAIGPQGGYLGSSMVVLDDFLDDGFPAIAVAAPFAGRVYVFRARDLSPGRELDLSNHDFWLEIRNDGVEIGTHLANLGDLDGDGRDDLAIGALTAGDSRVWLWSSTLPVLPQ